MNNNNNNNINNCKKQNNNSDNNIDNNKDIFLQRHLPKKKSVLKATEIIIISIWLFQSHVTLKTGQDNQNDLFRWRLCRGDMVDTYLIISASCPVNCKAELVITERKQYWSSSHPSTSIHQWCLISFRDDIKKLKTEMTASVQLTSRKQIKTHKRLKMNAFSYGLDETMYEFSAHVAFNKATNRYKTGKGEQT